MEYLLENILNMVGFLVGLCIGLASYLGYKNTGSPVLFRMSVAFLSIAIGFFVIWMGYVAEDLILQQGHIDRFVQTLGIAIQTVGYFFIAFSHGVKSFFPKNRALRSIAPFPLLISGTHIEHVLQKKHSFFSCLHMRVLFQLHHKCKSMNETERSTCSMCVPDIKSGNGAMERSARFFGKMILPHVRML